MMAGPAHRLRLIRGKRPPDDRAMARMEQFVDHILGLDEETVAWLPPSRQVGWMEPGQLAGGVVLSVICFPEQPSSFHVPVFADSYFATLPCTCCGRRLDQAPL